MYIKNRLDVDRVYKESSSFIYFFDRFNPYLGLCVLSRPHGRLCHSTYVITTRSEGLAGTRLLIKDAVAISAPTAGTAGDHVRTGTAPTHLGNVARRPDRRAVGLGAVADEAAIVHDHGGIGRVHDGPADAGALLDVVAEIEEGGGDVVEEARRDDHHGAAILQRRPDVVREDGVDDVGERSPPGVDDGSLLVVGTCIAAEMKWRI